MILEYFIATACDASLHKPAPNHYTTFLLQNTPCNLATFMKVHVDMEYSVGFVQSESITHFRESIPGVASCRIR